MSKHTPNPWQQSSCRAPMWMFGSPAGHCGATSYGVQYPRDYLKSTRYSSDFPFCFGHACPGHGGPKEGEPIIFQDGSTEGGRQMWCAVMPDFINLQESPAGFSGDPMKAIRLLRAAIAKARGDA